MSDSMRPPNRYYRGGMCDAELKEEIKKLRKAGVGPLATAVRLKVSARRVKRLLQGMYPSEDYVRECWGLNDNYL